MTKELDNGLAEDEIANDPLVRAGTPQKETKEVAPKKYDSVREAMSAAIEEVNKNVNDSDDEPDDKTEEKAPKKEAKKDASKARKAHIRDEKPDDIEGVHETSDTDDIENESEEETDKSDTAEKLDPPVSWSKEAKAHWNSLPKEVQQANIKREKEVSEGIKKYSESDKKLKEYEAVIQRHVPDYQKYGATPPQLVERTLQWLKALQNPDKKAAAQSFKQLAQNFGVDADVQSLYTPSQNSPTQESNTPGVASSPDVAQIRREIEDMKRQASLTEQQKAQAVVDTWKKDKPHFERVRMTMKALVDQGIVSNVDPAETLEAAYQMAVRADPELFEQVKSEELAKEKAKLEAERKAEREREKKAADIARSKKANVSLKPAAPVQNNAKAQKGRTMSVRESIDLARKELSGT